MGGVEDDRQLRGSYQLPRDPSDALGNVRWILTVRLHDFCIRLSRLERMNDNKSLPKLLLHACCGVCSSYVPELLIPDFEVTIYYENSNIYPAEEFARRAEATRAMAARYGIEFIEAPQDPPAWFRAVRGHAQDEERGPRCEICLAFRMRRAFEYAKEYGFAYVATTLGVSRNKSSDGINEVGRALAEEFDISYVDRDWKKNGGEDASQLRSKQEGIYRQKYCGCVYSWHARQRGAPSE